MKRTILVAGSALLVGIAAGVAIPKLRASPQSFDECMMDRMKGQSTAMFTIVYQFCQKATELKDSDIWPGKEEGWVPVPKANP